MHLCFVTQKYAPSPRSGSIGTVMRQLAQGFVSQGSRVHIITRADAGAQESIREEHGVVVHRIQPRELFGRLGWRLERRLPVLFRLRYSFRVNEELQALMRKEPIDCVVSAEYAAETWWYAVFNKRAPLVVSLYGPSFIANALNGRRGISARLDTWLECGLVQRADRIHAVSAHLAERVAMRFGIARKRIVVIHNPIDVETFHSNGTGHEEESDAPCVLYVGRLERLKGVEVLAQAIPLIHQHRPKVRFLFIGRDGSLPGSARSMRERLVELLGSSADRVTFLEEVPREELVRYYRRSTCCAFPSFSEGLPTVSLEAMACGRPVVGTYGTGHAEMIEPQMTGLLVSPGDARSLAQAILQLVNDASLRVRLGQAARAAIEQRFTLSHALSQWGELLEGLNRGNRCHS